MKRPVGKFGKYMIAAVAALLLMAVLPAMADSHSNGVTLDRGQRPGADDRIGDNSDDSRNSNDDSSNQQSNNNGPHRPDRPTFSKTDDFTPLNNNTDQTPPPTFTDQTNPPAQAPADVPQIPEPATLLLTGTTMLLIARKLRK